MGSNGCDKCIGGTYMGQKGSIETIRVVFSSSSRIKELHFEIPIEKVIKYFNPIYFYRKEIKIETDIKYKAAALIIDYLDSGYLQRVDHLSIDEFNQLINTMKKIGIDNNGQKLFAPPGLY